MIYSQGNVTLQSFSMGNTCPIFEYKKFKNHEEVQSICLAVRRA